MSHIVIVDTRELNGECTFLKNDRDAVAQFVDSDEAEACIEAHPLSEYPYMVVNLNTAEVVN